MNDWDGLAAKKRCPATHGSHRKSRRWLLPAASVAMAAILLWPSLWGGQTEIRDGLTFASGDLAKALDRQLVAEQRLGGETRILMTVTDETGNLCRGFVRADLSGIACRMDDGWHLRIQRNGVNVASGDSGQAEAVEQAVIVGANGIAAGPALDAAQERSAKARGWKPQ